MLVVHRPSVQGNNESFTNSRDDSFGDSYNDESEDGTLRRKEVSPHAKLCSLIFMYLISFLKLRTHANTV